MEKMREGWTDERLDDLKDSVGDLGRRVDSGFTEVRSELRYEVDLLRKEMREEFGVLSERFDALQRTMIQFGGGLAAAFGAALVGLIATQV